MKQNNYENQSKNKKIKRKYWILGMILGISTFSMMSCNSSDEEVKGTVGYEMEETVDKLQKFTKMECENEKVLFRFDANDESEDLEEWILTYTEENEFVKIKDEKVIECFVEAFGVDCFSDNGYVVYDLDENEVRVYLDCELQEGRLSIVNYNIEDAEYVLMVDGENYNPSDAFIDFFEEKEFDTIIEKDVEKFKNQLKDQQISFEEVSDLKYEQIKK